ncbi:RIMS-binding protein 2 isoform X1 [Perca flavescens]|uniref:RIMS-binding protein 2 isoform X1 n=1 Tax=Perca flavescens TaxID=8167 RepID=UPI00106EEDB9|nr:RIMS-binding protein 2 isoform X1 [Perca flavescens]XP_028433330.1 RIMS-binding protein 2 isoform X1 [Perca flavescens]XP_028433331.1 RIMS-binding protein 2 isoform X1 [Perca flavescens]
MTSSGTADYDKRLGKHANRSVMGTMGCQKTCKMEKLLKQSQWEVAWSQRQRLATAKKNSRIRGTDKLRNEVLPLQLPGAQRLDSFRLLKDNSGALRLNPETPSHQRQKQKLLETEISTRRKECEALEAEVKKKNQTCQTLENELQDFLQENKHLNLQFFNNSHKTSEYEKVKSEYAQLKETLGAVTQERDLALWERNQLQGKLENLEQVLKHMREAAERRQQLELEHEQALAVLNAKQQEIEVLQKAQVEAKKEHEGAVHLLENHLDSMQAKVRELEEKCRSQSEQFNLLSKELEKFRLQAGKFDILSTEPLTLCESPGSPNKSLSQLLNGLAAPIGKGNEAPTSRSLISEFIRPLQISGDKPELLSVKPTFLTRGRVSSPARASHSEMDKELSSTTRSKLRFTGKVRLCIARYSYNPYDGPNEHPEAELPLVAGKYLYVYGTMDEDGFYEGELLDGQRGLVPSNFVEFVQDAETTSAQHRDTVAKEPGYLNHSSLGPQRLKFGTGTGTSISSLLSDSKLDCLSTSSLGMDLLGSSSNGTGTLDVSTDEVGEDIVPYPRRINLIKQLAKSVIIGWDPPVVPPGWGSISGYNVLVDKEVCMSVPYGGRTKSLLEKLNLATNTYRISVQSITDRGPSDELRCTLLVGKDVVVAPYYLRVDSITQVSAELSWMSSNSNYSHTIFLNGAEYDMVKAGGYKYKFFNLKSMTVYKVKVVAQPHQVPWQLPMGQRDKREISVEFCTQPAVCVLCSSGPPLPPQEVQVQCGQTPGVLQVRWKPPPLTSSGTSNGASVIGYAVCTKGQKIAEVLYPTADYTTVELNRIQCLEARELIVRTLSTQGESQDSPVAVIPHNLLGSPRLSHRTIAPSHTMALPQSHPAHSQTHPPYPSTYPLNHPQPQVQPLPRTQPHTLPHAQPHSQPVCQPPSHPQPHFQCHPMPKSKPLVSAREPETKEHEVGLRTAQPWERSPSPLPPMRGPNLEPPHFQPRRSPSPQRILPQPQGVPIPNTIAKAMAREAAQRVFAEGNQVEKRNIFSERGNALHPLNSDEEEDGYDSPHSRRRGASVDEFLRGSELGRQHHHPHYSHSEEYHTESSRGSDLSDIMEEDEEDLYSEMQLEEGRRRSINSHNTLKIIGNSASHGSADRLEHSGRRPVHIGNPPQQRPIPSIEITMDSNSEGSEGNLSPVKEDVYYGSVARRRIWRSMSSEDQYDGYGGRRHGRGRRSPEYFEESEPEEMTRVFVALFDYDPMSMSPNPDAADEELPFKEGQIIKVFGNKDTDGFYRAEVRDRVGLIPCNMVSEIQTEDDDMMDQLLKQGFLPLNTPVEKLVNCDRFKDGRSINRRSRKSKRERNRRSGRQHPMSTRRMVALYDYDPRESSPNVDVEYEGNRLNEEAELTFCAGDVITVFGEIDEDGFYYGELNGHKGLVPSNFLEEVPDDVEVFLTDSPSRYPQDTRVSAARIKTKRVPLEKSGPPRRAGSPTVRPHIPGSGPATVGPGRLIRAPPDMYSSKKKKGLLSKGKTLLQRLGAVK